MNHRSLLALALLLSLSSCAYTQYVRVDKHPIPPTEHASIVHGSTGRAPQIQERLGMPHVSARERVALAIERDHEFTAQLGSDDYRIVGNLTASDDSGFGSTAALEAALCKRAAQEGGEVVLVVDSRTTLYSYQYEVPKTATTTSGLDTYQTSYTETQQGHFRGYSTTAIVFKYVPGLAARRSALLGLDDAELAAALEKIHAINEDTSIPFDEAERRKAAVIDGARSVTKAVVP